jgi:hypothetical protein
MVIAWPEFSSTSFARQVQHVGFYLFAVYFTNSMILFGYLGWIAYSMLNILAQNIQSNIDDVDEEIQGHQLIHCSQTDMWHRRLVAWKSQYYGIGEYVHSINNCLGPLILLLVTCYFILMVNNSFALLSFLKMSNFQWKSNCIEYAINLAKDFVYFNAFVYLPGLVSQEVTNLL